jgi:hypothetical protein
MQAITHFIFSQLCYFGFRNVSARLIKYPFVLNTLIERKTLYQYSALLNQSDIKSLNDNLIIKIILNHDQDDTVYKLTKKEIENRSLCERVIEDSIALNQPKMMFKLYKQNLFRAYANQNVIFLNHLINQAMLKNNQESKQVLDLVLNSCEDGIVDFLSVLSPETLKSFFCYALNSNNQTFSEILKNKDLFEKILSAHENPYDFYQIITKHMNPSLIATLRELPEKFLEFKQYLELKSTENVDSTLFNRIVAILDHPYSRDLISTQTIENILKYAIKFSNENSDPWDDYDQTLEKKLITDIIEYHYFEPSVSILKKLMRMLVKFNKIDDLFKLKKYTNFDSAFDQDLYIYTFEAAIEKKSRFVKELTDHPLYYNLDFDHQLNLLKYFIEQSKYDDIFLKFSKPDFYQFFSEKSVEKIRLSIMSTRHFKPIPQDQKIAFKLWAELFLKQATINNQSIHKIININELINKESIDGFQKLKLLLDELGNIRFIIKYARAYPGENPHHLMALHLLMNQEEIDKAESVNYRALENNESAQDKKLVLKAQRMFLKVQAAFQDKFNSYGRTDAIRVNKIEEEIKAKLLDLILEQAKEQKIKNINVARQNKIITYINNNKAKLIIGDQAATKAFRTILLDIPNPLQTTNFETAWLSYDTGHVMGNVGWDSYRKFFVNPPARFQQDYTYTTSEASNNAVINAHASSEVRKRACYYWLLANDPNEVENKEFRIGNFFGTISSIYRSEGFGYSCCYPGHLTAIMNMGLQHTIGNPVGAQEAIDNLVISVVRNQIKKTLTERVDWTIDQKAEKLSEFLAFKPDNAKAILQTQNNQASTYELFYQSIYKNLETLTSQVLKDISQDIKSETPLPILKAMIENAILGFSKNPFILTSITEDMLNTPCVLADINIEEDNVYLMSPNSPKYNLFSKLYLGVFNNLLNKTTKNMPSITQKGSITDSLKTITIKGGVKTKHSKNHLSPPLIGGRFFERLDANKEPSPVSATAEPPSPTRFAMLASVEGILDRAYLCIKVCYQRGR